MNALAFPLHTDERIVATLVTIDQAFSSRYGPGSQRIALRNSIDYLHEVCKVMEASGEAETEEALYFCVFDALAFVTSAIRFPGVNVHELRRAQAALGKLRDVAIPY